MLKKEEDSLKFCKLCHRCEHRVRFIEAGIRPRYECGDTSQAVSTCYMYKPTKPVAVRVSDGYKKRPVFGPYMLSARVCGYEVPENLALCISEIKGVIRSWWEPNDKEQTKGRKKMIKTKKDKKSICSAFQEGDRIADLAARYKVPILEIENVIRQDMLAVECGGPKIRTIDSVLNLYEFKGKTWKYTGNEGDRVRCPACGVLVSANAIHPELRECGYCLSGDQYPTRKRKGSK